MIIIIESLVVIYDGQWTAAGHRGVNGQTVSQAVDTSVEHEPARAPPLSTAALVAMVISNKECYVAAPVLVCLPILSSSDFEICLTTVLCFKLHKCLNVS